MNKFAFIDRDGTIIEEPKDFQVDQISKIKLVPSVIPALLELQSFGYKLIMVTNQDGLGTPSFPQEDFEIPHQFMMSLLETQNIKFDEILICPHMPNDNCLCRKPHLGLVRKYLTDYSIDLAQSFVVGDRESDLLLAKNMGIKGFQIGPELSWEQIIDQIKGQKRQSKINRKTKETQISIDLTLEDSRPSQINTGSGFFDHMLEQIIKHSGSSARIQVKGDWEIDDHHTIEDVGLALGEAFNQALGDRFGIERYAFSLPMDETEAHCLLDLGGRPHFKGEFSFGREKVNDLSTEMVPHFFLSFSQNLKANLHLKVAGVNEHHKIEALFKATGKTLGQAVRITSQQVPSSKGVL